VEGSDWENCSSKPSQAQSLRNPHLNQQLEKIAWYLWSKLHGNLRVGESWFQASLAKKFARQHLKKKKGGCGSMHLSSQKRWEE
jgi:hypothetical protein